MSNRDVCRFDSAEDLRGKRRSYESVKAAVLKAGRFSCFEASEDAPTFNQLCRDPELETFDLCYPWTGIRKRDSATGERSEGE